MKRVSVTGIFCTAFLLFSEVTGIWGQVDVPPTGVGMPTYVPGRDFLFRSIPEYNNYAFDDYTLPELTSYYRRNYYGPMGDFLINGYELYEWRETRATHRMDTRPNSLISKLHPTDVRRRFQLFKWNVVARESYRERSAALIVGEEIRTVLSPLTLRMAGINGVRLDTRTRHTRFSLIGSRWGRPIWSGWTDISPHVRNSSMLLASRGEVEVGTMRVGANMVNYHLFDANQESFQLRGQLRGSQVTPSYLVVVFSDDAPDDETPGATINEVRLRINGAPSDLRPEIVRINASNPTALGRFDRLTGEFTRTSYTDYGTKYADYFYLRDHLRGERVDNVNLDELVRFLEILPDGQRYEADGEWVILAYFDLRGERIIRQAEVEALVGNNYRIEVFGIYDSDTRQRRHESRWRIGGSEMTVLPRGDRLPGAVGAVRRSEGRVGDLSNLGWVRIPIGAFTGRVVASVDGHWRSGGSEVRWELARSLDFYQYPDGVPEHRSAAEMTGVREWNGERHTEQDLAYYLTGVWRGSRFEGGGEVFAIGPDFHRPMEPTSNAPVIPADGFVENNDDNDRWPDAGPGDRSGHAGSMNQDPTGVFPGEDDIWGDGIPSTNRNLSGVPDYLEPFMLFDVEPNDYVYGRDRNHNGVPDAREDNPFPNFPYHMDQKGVHVFGKVWLTSHWSFTLGWLDAEGIASGARNESTYGLLAYRRLSPGRSLLRFETWLERVRDDVEAPYYLTEVVLGPAALGVRWTPPGHQDFTKVLVSDPLLWRNSVEQQHYLEARWTGTPGLRVEGNFRYSINHQRGGVLIEGRDLGKDRIHLLTSVLKAEYRWQPARRWLLIGQAKGMALQRRRASLYQVLQEEWTFVPIVKARYEFTPRTHVWMGAQGFPGLPYQVIDRADGYKSVEEQVWVAEMSNRTPYFGYDILMNAGVRYTSRQFDNPARELDNLDVFSVFMRVILGYPEM